MTLVGIPGFALTGTLNVEVNGTTGTVVTQVVNFANDDASVVEPAEKRPVAPLLLCRQQPVLSRNVARMLRKPVCAEHLSANRTDELPVTSISAETEKTKEFALCFLRRNYSRSHFNKLSDGRTIGSCNQKRTRRMSVEPAVTVSQSPLRGR